MTTKTTTVSKGDGSKEVTKEVIENGQKTSEKYILGPGESDKTRGKLKY